MSPIAFYREQKNKYELAAKQVSVKLTRIGWLRLLLISGVVCFGYFAFQTSHIQLFSGLAIAFLILFLVIVRMHLRWRKQQQINETYVALNDREILFLENGKMAFENGKQFSTKDHPYSFDLDVLGEGSLYQYLNRTNLFYGQKWLADSLLFPTMNPTQILQRQEAIAELSELRLWRQAFQINAELGKDSAAIITFIRKWKDQSINQAVFHQLAKWIFPIAGASSMIALYFTDNHWWFSLGITLFIFNLLLFASNAKKIVAQLGQLDQLDKTIENYANIFQLIENQKWESDQLKQLSTKIQSKLNPASEIMLELSGIYRSLSSVQNGFAMLVLNGTLLYHLHAFSKLINWKIKHADSIETWLLATGEIEGLISFANFKFNNPSYTFPSINNEFAVSFENLGHPMIRADRRVSNSIDFNQFPFAILTGSNMSGKSTFLRTIGIGIILGNAGSVIPATSSTLHPLNLMVSMRLSDSLSDSESYFFAEVKRLQSITEQLQKERCFVLLDELLRGTNSDDKRDGTIAVLKKMVKQQAIGIIATHDLEVCDTQVEFPSYIANYCFEVAIIENDLHFDYQLRNGICKNKSATFIMQKMNII
jgi:hypothetical protein